jgi:sulfite reductase alpha subunit-like flavoprotein
MDEYDVMSLPSETFVIMCASTTGQGDAPDNMRSFWAFLLRRSLGADSLTGTNFAVFGLGDSGYARYNAVAKRLDKRLEMLGAC